MRSIGRRRRRTRDGLAGRWALLAAVLVLYGACRRAPGSVTLASELDPRLAAPLMAAFERSTGIRVRVESDLSQPRAGGVVERLLRGEPGPVVDLVWTGDPTAALRLARAGLGSWVPAPGRARVLVVAAGTAAAERPRSIEDLVAERWRRRAAMGNLLQGTTPTHLAALAIQWGDARLERFLVALKANATTIASSGVEAAQAVGVGQVAFAWCGSDEAAAAGGGAAVVWPDQEGDGTLVVPTALVILQGAPHRAEAQRLRDFLTSPEAERQLAATGFVAASDAAQKRRLPVDWARTTDARDRLEPRLRRWMSF
jgi:iron(III) transport system substrate-binding protein